MTTYNELSTSVVGADVFKIKNYKDKGEFTMKKTNNKGFSLVELIVVIAIMAVLVGILAPQFLKYVNNSKVSTDITNAESFATAVNVAIADGNTGITGDSMTVAALATAIGVDAPVSKLNSSYTWGITYTRAGGVTAMTLDSKAIYPNPEVSGGYYATYHK